MGVLATEYYLLSQNNQQTNAQKTDYELLLALHQFNNYMDKNDYWGNNNYENTNLNGFFVRENIPCDFLDKTAFNGRTTDGQYHLELLNKGLTPDYNGWDPSTKSFGNPRGHPGYSDWMDTRTCNGSSCSEAPFSLYTAKEPMSTDEAINMLLGLALIKKFGSNDAKAMAEGIACRIIQYCQFNHSVFWAIRLPDGASLHSVCGTDVGTGNTIYYSYPFVKSSRYFNSTCVPWDFMSSTGFQYYMWQAISTYENQFQTNNVMAATLAAISNSWQIGINFNIGVCPICIHINIHVNNTPAGIVKVEGNQNNETFYLALWELLQDKSTNRFSITKAWDQLCTAPCEGPYKYDDYGTQADNGWASTYRWHNDIDGQYGGDWATGNFNGLDYMLMYNLIQIKYSSIAPYYVNYVDRSLDGYLPLKYYNNNTYATNAFPQKYIAFNSISSTQVIGLTTTPMVTTDPGNVTYVAGTSIHLKPGFHATQGSYFHAYIKDIDCSESHGPLNKSVNSDTNDYTGNMYTPFFDSLISVPKVLYKLTPEDSVSMEHTLPCPNDTLYFNGIDWDTTTWMYSYYWDFGNGVTSNIKNPKVFYQPGNYNFMLILTDSNNASDTIKVILKIPDCNNAITGTLAENPDCGSVPVPYDSIWLVDANDSIVAGVTPVITDSIGRFWFLQTELAALDSNAVFAFRSGNGFVLQDTAHRSIADWLSLSPLQLQLSDVLKREWKMTYSSDADSADVYAKALDLNENLYVAGRLVSDSTGNDYLTLKYNPQGTLRWAATYNSPYNNADKPEAICTDSLCNIYLTGASKDGSGKNDYLTIKYDSSGTQQWVVRYDASGNGSSQDIASCIKADRNGNVYVSGLTMNTSSDVNIVTIKYNASGQQQWTRNFYDGDYSQIYVTHKMSMILDSLGNIYLAGSCKDSLGDNQYLLLKYNASGTLQWSAKNNINSQMGDYAAAIALDNSGNLIATGNAGTVKYSNNGVLQWQQTGSFSKLAVDASGDVYAGNYKPAILAKHSNSSGSVIWQIDSTKVCDFAVDRNDDMYTISDHEIVKLDAAGNQITSKSFSSYGIAVCVSPNLNVYVTGNITQTGGGQGVADIVTTKYSQCPSVATLKSMATQPPNNTAPMVTKTEKPVKIVPNPNNGEMVLLANNNFEIGCIFRIYDLTGRVLYQKTITEETTQVQVSTSDLQNGVYLYSVVSPQGKLLAKDKLVIMK
jgi:hypothetical protein